MPFAYRYSHPDAWPYEYPVPFSYHDAYRHAYPHLYHYRYPYLWRQLILKQNPHSDHHPHQPKYGAAVNI